MNGIPLFPFILVLTGCASDLGSAHRNAVQWASEEAGSASEHAGIANQTTYPKIVKKALKGKQESLSKVFQVSPVADAAGYELQSGIVVIILQTIGDTAFSAALKKEEPDVIQSNREMIAGDSSIASENYPQTMSLK